MHVNILVYKLHMNINRDVLFLIETSDTIVRG